MTKSEEEHKETKAQLRSKEMELGKEKKEVERLTAVAAGAEKAAADHATEREELMRRIEDLEKLAAAEGARADAAEAQEERTREEMAEQLARPTKEAEVLTHALGDADGELVACGKWAEEKDGEIRRLQQVCKAANGEVEKLKTLLANAAANAARQSAAAAEAEGGAQAEVERLRGQLEELKAQITTFEEKTEYLERSLEEAAAEARRAVTHAAEECKRLTAMMAERLESELEAARRGERAKADAQLRRLLAELQSMAVAAADMDEQLRELHARLESERAEVAQAAAKVAALERRVGELQGAEERIRAIERSEAEARAALEKILEELGIKTAENISLNDSAHRTHDDDDDVHDEGGGGVHADDVHADVHDGDDDSNDNDVSLSESTHRGHLRALGPHATPQSVAHVPHASHAA